MHTEYFVIMTHFLHPENRKGFEKFDEHFLMRTFRISKTGMKGCFAPSKTCEQNKNRFSVSNIPLVVFVQNWNSNVNSKEAIVDVSARFLARSTLAISISEWIQYSLYENWYVFFSRKSRRLLDGSSAALLLCRFSVLVIIVCSRFQFGPVVVMAQWVNHTHLGAPLTLFFYHLCSYSKAVIRERNAFWTGCFNSYQKLWSLIFRSQYDEKPCIIRLSVIRIGIHEYSIKEGTSMYSSSWYSMRTRSFHPLLVCKFALLWVRETASDSEARQVSPFCPFYSDRFCFHELAVKLGKDRWDLNTRVFF